MRNGHRFHQKQQPAESTTSRVNTSRASNLLPSKHPAQIHCNSFVSKRQNRIKLYHNITIMDWGNNRERYPDFNNMASDRQDFIIHEDPRPEERDDAQRERIFGKMPKDLQKHLETKFMLSFGRFTLLETRGFYDNATTADKRLLVGKWLEACQGRNDGWFAKRKEIFDFLQWPFKCPDCKAKRRSEKYLYSEFILQMSGDGVSEPVLESRMRCNGCPAPKPSS